MSEPTQVVEPNQNTDETGIDSLPESWQKEIKSLRSESAKHRTKANELESKLVSMGDYEDLKAKAQADAEKNGEFKTLYEETNAKLETLRGLEDENKQFKTYFEEKLNSLLEGVDEVTADLIKSSKKSMAEKVATAEKLSKAEVTPGSSKGASRPGGGATQTEADYLNRLNDAKTSSERIKVLNEARGVSQELHEKLKAHMMG